MKILLFLHAEQSTAGRVGRILSELGHEVVEARPCIDGYLPIALEQADALVVFGGPMSVNDPEMASELLLIEQFLQQQKPYLGICLGAQFLNRAYGGRVVRSQAGQVQMGWHALGERDRLFADLDWVYQWHSEWIDPADEFRVSCRDSQGRVQAIQKGVHWGIQFHPEVDDEMRQRWLDRASHKLIGPGAKPAATHMTDACQYEPTIEPWCKKFLIQWLSAKTG